MRLDDALRDELFQGYQHRAALRAGVEAFLLMTVDDPDMTMRCLDRLKEISVLFGEAQSRIVFTTDAAQADAVARVLEGRPVQAHRLGTVAADGLRLSVHGQTVVDLPRAAMHGPYEQAIPEQMSS